jgi:DNA polymerase elongation subunit (family B)
MIAKSALIVTKKKYAFWVVDDDRKPTDEIKITGLEIVRSDTPEIIRPMLSNVLDIILKEPDVSTVHSIVSKYVNSLNNASPEEISINVGAHNLDKYIDKDNQYGKGTPYHVKGIANYRTLLKRLKINSKYEDLAENSKLKVVYIKKNPYNIETISFTEWPKEFDKIIQVDNQKMINKFFMKKVKILMEPLGQKEMFSDNTSEAFNLFF